MKIKVFILFCMSLFILSSISFVSCNSSFIPGKTSVISQNIHIEYDKLGDNYYSLEKYNDAISAYEKASNDKSLYWNCYYKIAKCYVFLAKWDKALPMFEELLNKDSSNSSLKASIAYIYSMTGDYKSALAFYDEIIKEQPKDEKYKENYLAILLASEEIFLENKIIFENSFKSFKEDYPENSNINIFQERYEKYTVVKEESK